MEYAFEAHVEGSCGQPGGHADGNQGPHVLERVTSLGQELGSGSQLSGDLGPIPPPLGLRLIGYLASCF